MTGQFSLVHLKRDPRSGEGRPPLLILLHGIGSNEHDLFSLEPYLDKRFLVLSVRAPFMPAPGYFAWYAMQIIPTGYLIDPQQAEASRLRIIQFIGEALAAYGADPARVYLMGFSQGAIMSASVALTRPDLVAGAVLMSGRILDEVRPQIAPVEQLAGLPILLVHGTSDNVIPVDHAREARVLLESLPVQLTYREYPMGHMISPESLADVVAWLTACIEGSGIRGRGSGDA